MRFRLYIGTVAAAALCAVPAANAGLLDPVTQLVAPTCGTNSYPFAQFGDAYPYFGFGNNGFESGSTGWALSGGAAVKSGNEPWYVNGFGSHSLSLPQGASATSPAFCINVFDPVARAFAKGTAGGDLNVQVIFRGLTGNLTGIFNVTDQGGTGAWGPTDPLSSRLALPIGTTSAQIRFTSASGSWQLDDVFVDPSVARFG
jgi:hypothetical protein